VIEDPKAGVCNILVRDAGGEPDQLATFITDNGEADPGSTNVKVVLPNPDAEYNITMPAQGTCVDSAAQRRRRKQDADARTLVQNLHRPDCRRLMREFILQDWLEHGRQKILVIITKKKFADWLRKSELPDKLVIEDFDIARGATVCWPASSFARPT
jgi:hypothetical protein